jgi:hypothetical protein
MRCVYITRARCILTDDHLSFSRKFFELNVHNNLTISKGGKKKAKTDISGKNILHTR